MNSFVRCTKSIIESPLVIAVVFDYKKIEFDTEHKESRHITKFPIYILLDRFLDSIKHYTQINLIFTLNYIRISK